MQNINVQKDYNTTSKKGYGTNLGNNPSLDLTKLPPQALDLEEAVLGAIMLEKQALNAVIEILKVEAFYKEAHGKIFRAIAILFEKSEPIDVLTVTEQLRINGDLESVGGPYYVTQLTNRVGSAAHVEHHSRIIIQKYIQRELISISNKIIQDAYDDSTDIFQLMDRAEKGLFEVTENNLRKSTERINVVVKQSLTALEELRHKTDGHTGVPSGFSNLDKITGGWQKSDLVILAARPGMGKTAFVLSAARNAAVDHNMPVAVFSLEMSSIQLVNRLISGETELAGDKIRKGDLKDHEWAQLTEKVGKLNDAPIFIDDTPALTIFELRAKCRRLKAKHDIQLIIIDYLQLMNGTSESNKGGNREQEIGGISRALKQLAKELEVPVIALSQLNRSVETRTGSKRPQLSDLRESGSIEQDADMVMFIYRAEYYDLDQDDEGNSTEDMAQLIIAKNRHGAQEDVDVRFIKEYAKFVDINSTQYGPSGGGFDDNSPNSGHSVLTRSSKLNDDEDFGFMEDDDELL
ncbi:MAG: replicative DNA helicase [Sphingobacteriales bacterium]|jgi:replicative DNA helicase